MTRPIRPHKGGRTARAPEARIRPQTLQRIRATMQERDRSFADLLEETYSGGITMYAFTFTEEEVADKIAAAVAAERERMITRAETAEIRLAASEARLEHESRRIEQLEAVLRIIENDRRVNPEWFGELFAAIRARGNGAGRE